MSLINEALKRAKHAQKKDAPPPLASSAALRPTEPARPTGINYLLPVTLDGQASYVARMFFITVCRDSLWNQHFPYEIEDRWLHGRISPQRLGYRRVNILAVGFAIP